MNRTPRCPHPVDQRRVIAPSAVVAPTPEGQDDMVFGATTEREFCRLCGTELTEPQGN